MIRQIPITDKEHNCVFCTTPTKRVVAAKKGKETLIKICPDCARKIYQESLPKNESVDKLKLTKCTYESLSQKDKLLFLTTAISAEFTHSAHLKQKLINAENKIWTPHEAFLYEYHQMGK